jgi:hypothetical protein
MKTTVKSDDVGPFCAGDWRLQECDKMTQFECGEDDVVSLRSQILLDRNVCLERTAKWPSSATISTKAKDDAPIFVVIECLPTEAKQEFFAEERKTVQRFCSTRAVLRFHLRGSW